jgi:hypothetical protein
MKYHWDGTNNNFYGSAVFSSSVTVNGNILYINGGQPETRYAENDVGALPLGLWRTVLGGDSFYVQKNTAVAGDFSTATKCLIFSNVCAATFSSSIKAVSGLLQSANTDAVVDIFSLYNPSATSSGVRQKFANGFGDLAAIKVSQRDNGALADDGQIEFQVASNSTLATKLSILNNGVVTINSSYFVPFVINSTYGQLGIEFQNSGTGFGGIGSANNFTSDAGILGTDLGMGTNGSSTNRIVFATGAGYSTRMVIGSGGNVLIGTTTDSAGVRLKVSGGIIGCLDVYNNTTGVAANMQIDSNGFFSRSTVSSLRYKENIKDWNGNGLDTILALKPKTFKYKKDYYNKADIDFLGLIAEDVAEISPYLADYENEDRTGQVENVRYAFIVVPLIKAIQELKAEIETLKNK